MPDDGGDGIDLSVAQVMPRLFDAHHRAVKQQIQFEISNRASALENLIEMITLQIRRRRPFADDLHTVVKQYCFHGGMLPLATLVQQYVVTCEIEHLHAGVKRTEPHAAIIASTDNAGSNKRARLF